MGRVYYKDSDDVSPQTQVSNESSYNEPASVYITEDWDTLMEDFLDDFDDYQDVNFPSTDDDI